jgi:hypothetical protein
MDVKRRHGNVKVLQEPSRITVAENLVTHILQGAEIEVT